MKNYRKTAKHKESPIDQANLDLGVVKAFIEVVFELDAHRCIDGLPAGTLSALAYECQGRIENLDKFIGSIPHGAAEQVRAA